MNNLQFDVAARVAAERRRIRCTQADFAKRIGVNPLTYRGYENGRSQIPLVVLWRIADFLDLSVDYLLGRTDPDYSRIHWYREEAAADD